MILVFKAVVMSGSHLLMHLCMAFFRPQRYDLLVILVFKFEVMSNSIIIMHFCMACIQTKRVCEFWFPMRGAMLA